MSQVLVLSGSPSPTSRTGGMLEHVGARLRRQGHSVRTVAVRDLPAQALLAGDTGHPEIAAVAAAVAAADGVVVASPVFKASFSGLLKALLDLLPQFALAD